MSEYKEKNRYEHKYDFSILGLLVQCWQLSLCRHLNLHMNIENEALSSYIEQYFTDNAKYLGNITVSAAQDRFCILVGSEGCDYVEKMVPEPEFLAQFLAVLRCQNMQSIIEYFEAFAQKQGTSVCIKKEEEGLETILHFADEDIEPYVYCIDQNEFGITYHRFTREDYDHL